MRRLSRPCTIFAGFWFLAAGSAGLAHAERPAQAASSASEIPSLSKLKVTRSSREDVPDTITVETAEIPDQPTRLFDQLGMMRLMQNEGVTLQWIDWDKRGPVWVAVAEGGYWTLLGGQKGDGGAVLDLEGFITEIGTDYFDFQGTIRMRGAPDAERVCRDTRTWRFEVTQNRSYYRLREFEWCDDLTDYIDVYFDPSLR